MATYFDPLEKQEHLIALKRSACFLRKWTLSIEFKTFVSGKPKLIEVNTKTDFRSLG